LQSCTGQVLCNLLTDIAIASCDKLVHGSFYTSHCYLLYVGSSPADSAVDESSAVDMNDADSACVVSSSDHSSYSESDFLLMSSLQVGALKTLGVLLRSSKYIELLLVPRDSSDDEKMTSRLNSGTGHDDLQVAKFFV